MTETLEHEETGSLEAEMAVKEQIELHTKKFALQHLLDKASKVVPTRDILPVLKNFLIVAEPGKLHATATNLELSVIASTEMVTVQQAGSAVLPAKQLMDIVREAADDELVLRVSENVAQVRVGRTEWELKLQSGDEYPELPDTEECEFTQVDRAKFVGWIKSVRYAAAQETHRPSLMMIDVTDGEMRTSDGVRYQQVTVGDALPNLQIPINAVDDLVSILTTTEAPTLEIGQDDDCLIFKIGGDIFIAQKLTAEFPPMDHLLKPALANDQLLSCDRLELIKALKRVKITADAETNAIILALSKDKMVVQSKNKLGSNCREELDVKWDGAERQIAFNYEHLLQMLHMTDQTSCQFRLGEDTKTRPTPLLLRDDDAGQLGMLNQIRADWL